MVRLRQLDGRGAWAYSWGMNLRCLYIILFVCALPCVAWAAEREVDLQCLREAYPGSIEGMETDAQGRAWILLRDGGRVLYDGAQPESQRAEAWALQNGDVRASMAQLYPLEPQRPVPAAGEHPGRVRSYALLGALYGETEKDVQAGLENMSVLGTQIRFSRRAGAADALRRVNAALAELLRGEPQWRAWVLPLGGTHKWRRIAGEHRLSPHSYGMAVDLNPRKGAYWRWSGGNLHPAQKEFPSAIVKIFEDNGFIWGGKWREYDVMHFEYRPEIICKARTLAGE